MNDVKAERDASATEVQQLQEQLAAHQSKLAAGSAVVAATENNNLQWKSAASGACGAFAGAVKQLHVVVGSDAGGAVPGVRAVVALLPAVCHLKRPLSCDVDVSIVLIGG